MYKVQSRFNAFVFIHFTFYIIHYTLIQTKNGIRLV